MRWKSEFVDPRSALFVFSHVPKTAGMSVHYYFESMFGRESCQRVASDEEVVRYHQGSIEIGNTTRFFSAHLPVSEILEHLPDKPMFVFSILREPIEREISCFHYMRDVQGKDVRTIDDYIELLKCSPLLVNQQSRYMADGLDISSANGKDVLLNHILRSRAFFTVKKLFFLQEYMRSLINSDIVIEHVNVNKGRDCVTDVQINEIARLVSLDRELFDNASDFGGAYIPDWRFRFSQQSPNK